MTRVAVVAGLGVTSTSPRRSNTPHCAFSARIYRSEDMTAIRFSDLVARFNATETPQREDSTLSSSPVFYATAHSDVTEDGPSVPRYFAIQTALDSNPALYLTHYDGVLEARPSEPDDNAVPLSDPTPFFAPLWLVKLHDLRIAALAPNVDGLFRIPFLSDESPTKPNWTRNRCHQAVIDQTESFRLRRRAFFPSHENWFEWECWSRAKSWIQSDVSTEDACSAIGVDVSTHERTMREILKRCRKASKKPSADHPEEWIDVATTVTPPLTQSNAVVASVMKPFVTPPLLGGDPDLTFPTPANCLHLSRLPLFDKQRQEPPKALWWWRSFNLPDIWPADLQDLFVHNWAQSAFFYEYRCRRNRLAEEPWFGVPWPTLNHVQRAILRALWPPIGGSQTVVRPAHPAISEFGMLSRVTLQIPVDLAIMSDRAIGALAEGLAKEERRKRNIPSFDQGAGRSQSTFRWTVLEAMDQKAHSRTYKFPATVRTAKSAVEKSYLEACEAAQIEP